MFYFRANARTLFNNLAYLASETDSEALKRLLIDY